MFNEKTPDEWIHHTEFIVREGLEDINRGINSSHKLHKFYPYGCLVGNGFSPEEAYQTVEN